MLLLAAPGNPDRQQYTYTAAPAVYLDTVRQRLVTAACRYRDLCGMGGGNWGGVCGMVYCPSDGGRLSAVTYNGRLLSTNAELRCYNAAQYPRGATYDPAMVLDFAGTGFCELWGVGAAPAAEARITAFAAVVRARRSSPRWLLDALDVLEAR